MRKIIKLFWIVIMMQMTPVAFAQLPVELLEKQNITVYRSPTCGCCGKWIAHLKGNNFEVIDKITENMTDIKKKYAVNAKLASCHTAIINGHVVEGHVPAVDIIQMLKASNIKGLTVPGMVVGTPGMEMNDKKDPFNVIAFDEKGNTKLYRAYENY